MRWPRMALALVAALAVVYAPGALAQPDPVAYMRHLAPVYWATPGPCPSNYAVSFEPLQDDQGGVVYGQVQMTGAGTGGPYWTDCVMHLNSRVFPSARVILRRWPFFCEVYLHEFAHLLDVPDSPDPSAFLFHVVQVDRVPGYCLRSPTGRHWHRRDVYLAFP